jgi:hypothetical protein
MLFYNSARLLYRFASQIYIIITNACIISTRCSKPDKVGTYTGYIFAVSNTILTSPCLYKAVIGCLQSCHTIQIKKAPIVGDIPNPPL